MSQFSQNITTNLSPIDTFDPFGNNLFVERFKSIGKYCLLYFFIAMTSIPFFVSDIYLYLGFLISFILFIYKKQKVDLFIIVYSLIYFAIFMAQVFWFSVDEPNIILGYFFRIIYAYMTIKIIGEKIVDYYINIIFFFSIISLLFFIPYIFYPEQFDQLFRSLSELVEPFQIDTPGRDHFILYTYGLEYEDVDGDSAKSLIRNSGPFWEPGGYGIFLTIAILFEMIKKHRFFTKKTIVFLIALLSTLSTGAFFVFFIVVISYIILNPTILRIILLVLFSVLSMSIYSKLFFLSEKVNDQSSYNYSLKYAPRSRFVCAQLDWNDFVSNPILGRGRFESTRFDVKVDDTVSNINHRNNGTTNLLVEFGFFGFAAFFYFMYLSFARLCKVYRYKIQFAIIFTFIIIALGFSQKIFQKPFFIGLSFMFLAAYKKEDVELDLNDGK